MPHCPPNEGLTTKKRLSRITAQEREKRMFEISDSVMLKGFEKKIVGKIVSYSYDEGNVWVVRTEGGNVWDCGDDEISPA
jgi:hypothetical protein